MNIIGLTGGIATGKTTVSQFLSTLDTPIIDADIINQQLLMPHQEGYSKVLELFPETPLLSDLSLDKKYLRHKIFHHIDNKKKLELLLHPLIKNKIVFEIEALKQKEKKPYCMVAVPLLIEAKFTDIIDEIWVTDCSESIQINRLMKRDNSSLSDAKLIMSHQLSRKERLKYADQIITTDDHKMMENKITELHYQQIKLHSPPLYV